jgi:membrane fusion protein, multidrug efflux system
MTRLETSATRFKLGAAALSIVVVALLLLVSTGCGDTKKAQAVSQPPAPVTVGKAEVKVVPVTVAAVGNITPYTTVQVKSMVTAPVVSANFKPGDFVKKGQLLFALDDSSFKADVMRAEGQLVKDQAAAANAVVQAKRYAALFQQGVVAREQNDVMQSQADQAQAAVKADEAAVETAKINVRYCRITSPIDGRVGDVLVYPGNLIKANDINMAVINQLTPIYVDFSVPEQYLPEIKKHMASGELKVQSFFADPSQPPAEGKLTFIDNTVDPKTGAIGLKASFENKDHRLWPGQFVNTVITLSTLPRAVTVPLSAVQNGQKGPYVYVVSADKKAELRQVALGPQVQNLQVIDSGVNAGETVVTDGQLRVLPGAPVDIKAPGAQQGGAANAEQQSTQPNSATK